MEKKLRVIKDFFVLHGTEIFSISKDSYVTWKSDGYITLTLDENTSKDIFLSIVPNYEDYFEIVDPIEEEITQCIQKLVGLLQSDHSEEILEEIKLHNKDLIDSLYKLLGLSDVNNLKERIKDLETQVFVTESKLKSQYQDFVESISFGTNSSFDITYPNKFFTSQY
jgi:DNA replication protein DnaD